MLVVPFVFSPLSTHADAGLLSEADRIALTEQLEKIQQRSKDRVGGLYKRAIRDYRSAIKSDDATMALYMTCLEKVQFTDEKRKSQDFRDWKRRNKEKLSSSSMRMALRHQLAWLLLSIEAARREGDVSELGNRAMSHLDQIFKNAEVLKDHRSILSQSALGSVFARAYQLNIKVDDWPSSTMDIAQIYDKVVMPPLRNTTRIDSLRAAWKKRIQHEGLAVEKWSVRNGKKIGKKDALRTPDFEKFLSETRPQLLWDMEVDCFESGDEKVSAVRMLKHLETYISHKEAPTWIQDFQNIIYPPEDPDATKDGAVDAVVR
jgi:hypothetical protein